MTIDRPDDARDSVVAQVAIATAAAFVLLWAELFLTADAEEPNTWSGVVTDTIVLALGAGVALLLARAPRGRRFAGLAAFAATIVFAVPFWTGAVIPLGVCAYLLNRPDRQALAYIAAGLAALDAVFLLVSVVIDFAPGIPT